jgi:hypothetical protein
MTPTSTKLERDRGGAVGVALLAGVVTITDVVVLLRYDIAAAWALLQIPVLTLAWTGVFAWLRARWTFAGCCVVAMLGGLWGYLYVPPLVAVVLAGVAFSRAVRTNRLAIR